MDPKQPSETRGETGSSPPSSSEDKSLLAWALSDEDDTQGAPAPSPAPLADEQLTQTFDPFVPERDRIRAERERIRSEIDPFREAPSSASDASGSGSLGTLSQSSVSTPPPATYPGATSPPAPTSQPILAPKVEAAATAAASAMPVTTIARPARVDKPAVQVKRLRRGRLAIRKIAPLAVLRFSLVFYFCMTLIMLLGTAIIFATLKAFGVISSIEKLLRDLEINVQITGGVIFRWFFLIGLLGTVVFSAITTFMAFLYNLIADVVGGIELLVTERE